jgi:hypothetical protein
MIRLLRDARTYLELPAPAALVMVVAAAAMIKTDKFEWAMGTIVAFYFANFARQYLDLGSRLQRAIAKVRAGKDDSAHQEPC